MTEFERFFEAFTRKLDTVQIPAENFTGGEAAADSVSWDRKAAWLLYVAIMKGKQNDPS